MEFVLAIEAASFARPWAEADFLRTLRRRDCIGMVAERGDDVLGFVVYHLEKPRLTILNLAVHPASREVGIGRQMVAKLIGKLSPGRRTRIHASVPDDLYPAHKFFATQGFVAVGVDRGRDGADDEYRFHYELPDTAALVMGGGAGPGAGTAASLRRRFTEGKP